MHGASTFNSIRRISDGNVLFQHLFFIALYRLISWYMYFVITEARQPNRELEELLTKHCILTPFSTPSASTKIVSLAGFFKERGSVIAADKERMGQDIRKAVSYLRSNFETDCPVTTERIALQLVHIKCCYVRMAYCR